MREGQIPATLRKPWTCFMQQSFRKYLRQTQVFMWNSTLWEKFREKDCALNLYGVLRFS